MLLLFVVVFFFGVCWGGGGGGAVKIPDENLHQPCLNTNDGTCTLILAKTKTSDTKHVFLNHFAAQYAVQYIVIIFKHSYWNFIKH